MYAQALPMAEAGAALHYDRPSASTSAKMWPTRAMTERGPGVHLGILEGVVRRHQLAIDLGALHVVAHIRVHVVRKVHHCCALQVRSDWSTLLRL